MQWNEVDKGTDRNGMISKRGLQLTGVAMMGEAAELLRMLVEMEDVQASFLIMHLSPSSRSTYPLWRRVGTALLHKSQR